MLDHIDALMLFVYHEGLDVPLATLLDPKLYPRYRVAIERLAASGGDALDCVGADDSASHRLIVNRAARMVRVIMQHTSTPE